MQNLVVLGAQAPCFVRDIAGGMSANPLDTAEKYLAQFGMFNKKII